MTKPVLKQKPKTPEKTADTQVVSKGDQMLIIARIEDHKVKGAMYVVASNVRQKPGQWISSEAKESVAADAAYALMDTEGYEIDSEKSGYPLSFLTNGAVSQYDSRVMPIGSSI